MARKAPIWIDERDVLALHDRLLALDGGAAGLRDSNLLKSALARPGQLQAYGDQPDVIDLAAAYSAGIVRNHPFVDGNKRTGFIVGVLFLEINGYRFIASEADATQAVLALAAGALDEAAFAAWMRANTRATRTTASEDR
ncbi:MAG: type II toxin-antitoxin system death-on-curing family toxin [Candidatus Binataceae bacterium]